MALQEEEEEPQEMITNTSIRSGSHNTNGALRVSFRDDVVFMASERNTNNNNNHHNKSGRSGVSSTTSAEDDENGSHSTTTSTSGGVAGMVDDGAGSRSSTRSNHSKASYTKLRSNLTRQQRNRDPLYYYQITRHLGAGSMGEVKLVQKRANKIGGSARRDQRRAVLEQEQRAQACFQLPLIGGLFRLLFTLSPRNRNHVGDETDDAVADWSRHSFISLGSAKSTETEPTTTNDRSYEDSLLFQKSDSSLTADSASTNSTAATDTQITYAMKSIVLTAVSTRQEFLDELRNEIAILKSLDHPNIVRAIETFEYRGEISIVMECCSGGDLYTRDPYSEPAAARIVHSILNAVAYMHSRNVVHRDLKYENILFANTSPLSDIKLIDFGLSKVYVNATKMTEMVGTVYTMAPEVLMGEHTEKADIWSIGVIAFMLLSSSMPFYGIDRVKVIKKILKNKYAFKVRRWDKVSDEAKEFIASLLVKDVHARPDAETALQSTWMRKHHPNQSSSSSSSSFADYENDGNHASSPPPPPVGTITAPIMTTPTDLPTLHAEVEELVRNAIIKYARYPKLKQMALMVVAHKSSTEEIGILRKLFQKYDSRHDGSIWFEEFCQAMQGSGQSQEELRAIFDAMDLAGSGKILYTEFIAATIEAHGTISEARLAEAFDRLDCDDTGFITAENLIELLGSDVDREEINQIIAEADLTKDNRVSYSEFMALWESDQEFANTKHLESELSSFGLDESEREPNDAEAADARAEFLKEKHLQNTLHTWSMEMQLPAQEFAKGCSFLHQIALGDLSIVEKTLEERPLLVNFRDYDRRTPLHIAASEGLVDICAFLIKKGARVNRSDRWGGFPLDDAHRHGRSGVVDLLRLHGAKFGNTSRTANLITAASKGDVDEVKALLEFGSMDLNQGDYDYRTALHLAANEGHVEVVKLLCDAGADVNVKDRWGDRPLDDAKKAKKNASLIVKILEGGTLDVSSIRQAPRMDDLRNLSPEQMTMVAQPEDQMTPLPLQDFAMGCSVLHQAALGNKLVLEKIFLERPALVNFRDYDRRTAMHIAASEGQLEICKYLVHKGARINRCDRWGGSPLDDAHREKHADVVKFLRSKGAKFGSTSQITNFISAASEGDREELQAFLELGSVDVNQGDYDKRTALHLAVCSGHLDIVKMLCEAGANVNVVDRWGRRPLDDAKNAKANSAAIVKFLLENGAKSRNILTMVTTAFSTMLSK